MGPYRLSRWAFILMPLFAFGDFGVSDSATLNQIAIDVAHAANASMGADRSLGSIVSDTAYLTDVVYDSQQNLEVMQGYLYRLSNPGLRNITNGLWGILEKLNTDSQRHLSGPDTSTYHDSIYVHDVRNDDIYTRLGDIQQSINNLTNYLCYSPDYVSGVSSAVNTNFPFLFIPFASFASSTQDFKNRIKSVYQSLYGVTPSQQIIDRIYGLCNTYDFRRYFTSDRIKLIDEGALPSSYKGSWWSVVKNVWSLVPNSTTEEDYRNRYSQAYNYLYGTRQLTDTSIGISNVVSAISDTTIGISNVVANITNLLFDVESGGYLEPDTSSGGHGFRVASVVKEGVASVMDDAFFTGEVSTNIVGNVDTNAILQVADNSYKTDLDELKSSTPQDFHDLDGVLSEINTASGAIESVAEALSQDHNENFILRLPYNMNGVGSVDLSLTFDNMTSHTAPVVNLICHFLQIAIGLYFFRVGWTRVVATVNFHNVEDPF